MLVFVNDEVQIHVVPTSERAGGFADVLLRVIADTHGEELHDFSREIFVRRSLYVYTGIEKGEHPRILCFRDHQIAKISRAVLVEQFELSEHLPVITDLAFIHGKVAVPKQRHLFFQRMTRSDHAVRPPISDALRFQHARPQPVEELIYNRLNGTVAAWFDFDAESFTLFFRELCHGGPALREGLDAGIMDA